MKKIKVVVLNEKCTPTRAHPGDAGLDLRAARKETLDIYEYKPIPTGVCVEIPHGYVGLVCARSGLAARHGIGIVNGMGIIDAGYRGEIMMLPINNGSRPFVIEEGDRIAQLLIVPVALPEVEIVSELSESDRGTGGFGSTGR